MYVDNYIDHVLPSRFGVIVGCDIDLSDLGVSITQHPSILKSDDFQWPAACATGSVIL